MIKRNHILKNSSSPVEIAFLLEGLKRGDELAFATLYSQYADLLLSYGIGLGFGKEDIEDAIQEVFCNLFLHHNEAGDIQNLKFYLLRSLKNRLLNTERVSMNSSGLEDVNEANFHTEVTVLDDMIDEEERIRIKQQVESYLETLTGRQREAIYLRYMEGLEYEEIASLMDMTVPSVRNLVFRAIKQLRESNLSFFIPLLMLSMVK